MDELLFNLDDDNIDPDLIDIMINRELRSSSKVCTECNNFDLKTCEECPNYPYNYLDI